MQWNSETGLSQQSAEGKKGFPALRAPRTSAHPRHAQGAAQSRYLE
jgi:hypothetical protein